MQLKDLNPLINYVLLIQFRYKMWRPLIAVLHIHQCLRTESDTLLFSRHSFIKWFGNVDIFYLEILETEYIRYQSDTFQVIVWCEMLEFHLIMKRNLDFKAFCMLEQRRKPLSHGAVIPSVCPFKGLSQLGLDGNTERTNNPRPYIFSPCSHEFWPYLTESHSCIPCSNWWS